MYLISFHNTNKCGIDRALIPMTVTPLIKKQLNRHTFFPSVRQRKQYVPNPPPAVWSKDDIAHGLLKFDIELVQSRNNLWSTLGA